MASQFSSIFVNHNVIPITGHLFLGCVCVVTTAVVGKNTTRSLQPSALAWLESHIKSAKGS